MEISTAGLLFNVKIRLYVKQGNDYILYNEFTNDQFNTHTEIINLLFVNNNHFNILLNNESKFKRVSVVDKDINIKEFSNIINKKNECSQIFIKSLNLKNIKKCGYVNYNRKGLENYYDEIGEYIKDNTKIPFRLTNKANKNKKSQQKKRGKFKKMIAARYRIEENRLQYKYFYQNKKFIWLNIPFINEINPMLNFIHFSNHHLKKDRMAAHVIKKGFFWFGYTETINQFIQNCGQCHAISNITKIPKKQKLIITRGPHIRYQADIWYLPDELKENNYLYFLDIIDHFSKWSNSYLLKNKESQLVLAKIKSFILMNGPCKIFQMDNGLEFNNFNLKIYLENLNIDYIGSAPYHPQSNYIIINIS